MYWYQGSTSARSDLDLEFDLDDGCDDGEHRVVGGARPELPALERHVDVFVLNQCQGAEKACLEVERSLFCKNTLYWYLYY